MPLRLMLAASLPKGGHSPEENEDAFACDAKFPVTRFALSDGATDSYDSRTFARILCRQWAESRLHVIPLRTAQRTYANHFRGKQLDCFDAAALERGSFATLLACSVEGATLRVTAIGDSLIAIVHPPDDNSGNATGNTGGTLWTFPYSEAKEFEQSPLLLSTRREKSRDFNLNCIRERTPGAPPPPTRPPPPPLLRPGTTLLCMTDAVGAWFLAADPGQRRRLINDIRGEDPFRDFVNEERKRGALRNDDSTLLVFEMTESGAESRVESRE